MLSSGTLRAQIASVIEVLSKAAVAEISKVVEDGMVVLRLEVCQRENEIKKLKSNIELLHGELRAAHQTASQRTNPHPGRDESQGCVGAERNLVEKVQTDQVDNSPPVAEVQVKHEPVQEGSEESTRGTGSLRENVALYEGDQWQSTTPKNPGGKSLDFLSVGQSSLTCLLETPLDSGLNVACSSSGELQQSPFSRGMVGFSQHRNNTAYNAVRRRTMKRLFKKGFFCPYCGKCFGSIGHLERHKRIHTGEKPYPCEICGRRFNQKSTVKEHLKIHMRGTESRPVEVQMNEEEKTKESNPGTIKNLPEEKSQAKVDNNEPKKDNISVPVQVKSEPVEENISQPLFHEESKPPMEGPKELGENFTFQRDSQQWMMPRLQNNPEPNKSEFLNTSAQNVTSFPGIPHVLPPPVEASCSTFSFPGKTYGELKNNGNEQAPYRSSNNPTSSEASTSGMDYNTSRSWTKPKKTFVCSYCSKVFFQSSHLTRHFRIHTGEKPYGCHICGKCFNQNSSLKGHLKTHRNGELTDALQTQQLMLTMPDNQLYGNPIEPNNGLAASQEQVPGSTYDGTVGAGMVPVKLEPSEDNFQTTSHIGTDCRTGRLDQSPLWTSGKEKSASSTLHDVKYHFSLASGATTDNLGYMSPTKNLLFGDNNRNEELMKKHQFSLMDMHPSSGHLALPPGPNDPPIASDLVVSNYGSMSDRTHEGGIFEFNLSSHQETNSSSDVTMSNSFICSSCGSSFDDFDVFQRHPCEKVTEQSLS